MIFSQARDVRLLTGRGRLEDVARTRLANMLTWSCNKDRHDGRQVEIQWRAILDKGRYPFLHDRFAITDGALWHFGATVGGGYSGLTAVSGPWPATETRAVEFFEECWRRSNA